MAKQRFDGWSKIGVLLLALTLLAGLPGCAGLPFGATVEPVTLKFAYMENAADYAPLANAFHKENPHITVELVPVPLSGNSMRSLATYASQVDAVRLPSMMIQEDVAQALLPLDTMISTDLEFPQADLFPNTLESLRLDGKQVAIPAGINPYVFFYNTERFAAAGVQPPSANWTIEDFINTAISMNSPDKTGGVTFGYCTYPTFMDSIMFSYLFGGGILDDIYQPTMPTLNDPANVDALRWYTSLLTDFQLLPPEPLSDRAVGMFIAQGNCAFWMDTLNRGAFGRFGDVKSEPLPLPAYNAAFNVAELDAYSVIATSAHPEEAYQWISFLMQQQEASGSLVPPLRALASAAEYTARVSTGTAGVAQSIGDRTVMLGLEMYRDARLGNVIELYTRAAEQVMIEQIDAQTALDQAQSEAEEQFR